MQFFKKLKLSWKLNRWPPPNFSTLITKISEVLLYKLFFCYLIYSLLLFDEDFTGTYYVPGTT